MRHLKLYLYYYWKNQNGLYLQGRCFILKKFLIFFVVFAFYSLLNYNTVNFNNSNILFADNFDDIDFDDTLMEDPDDTVKILERIFADTELLVIDKYPDYLKNTNNVSFEGEEIVFNVRYGFMNVGNAVFRVEKSDKQIRGRDVLKISSEARSTGLFNRIYRVNTRVISYVDYNYMFALRYLNVQREGRRKVNENIAYNYDRNEAERSRVRLRRNRFDNHNAVFEIDKLIFDPLGALFFLRKVDFKVGDIVSIPVSSSESMYELKIEIKKKERIRTDIGRVECYVVSPLLLKEGIFLNKGDMDVWLTADDRRIPVRMQSSIAVGSITATIDSYTPGKYMSR